MMQIGRAFKRMCLYGLFVEVDLQILLIEDSEKLQFHMKEGLHRLGHKVSVAGDGRTGLWQAESKRFDLIILDLMLPGMDGLTLLERLREGGSDTSVLILTARDRVSDKVQGLRAGADDYMVKPFSFDELAARIEVLARRSLGVRNSEITLGPLVIDTAARAVTRNGKAIDLTAREYMLLELLAKRRGRVLSRGDIEACICDQNADVSSNVVDVAISSLRRKVDLPGEPSIIRTRRGMGYSIAIGDESCPSEGD